MTNRQLWILNHYAQEPGGPGGTRHFQLARHLRDQGWDATIIAASTELNTGRQRLLAAENDRLDEYDGVPFLWLRTPPYFDNGMSRIKNMLAYTFRALTSPSLGRLPRPDIVLGSSVHPFAALAGSILARRYKTPFLFEVRDLWPQTLIDLGRISENGVQARVMRAIEKYLYKKADRIIAVLPDADKYICPLGISREKVVWLPNGVELAGYPKPEAPLPQKKFTLMYFGAHGIANGLENVIHAFSTARHMPGGECLALRLIGDGPSKAALMELASTLNIVSEVSFEPPVPKSQIPALAAEADAFVFNLIDAPVFRFGISSNKLFDYLAAARPILFCCEASNNPVAHANAGLTIPPGDAEKLALAMIEVANLPAEDLHSFGRNARSFVEANHDFSSLACKLARTLDELVPRNT